MAYADYTFYWVEYAGRSIGEKDFPRLAIRASTFLDLCTMGRAASRANMKAVKMACCAVAEAYQSVESAQVLASLSLSPGSSETLASDGELQSESVGSWSKSFRSRGSSASDALKAESAAKEMLWDTAKQYLAGTGLLRARGYMA